MMMKIFVVLIFALLSPTIQGQTVDGPWELLHRFDGLSAEDRLGESVSGAGDVDGDGFPDILVGSRYSDPNGLSSAGSAFVYSGATGNLIWEFQGSQAGDEFGTSVSDAGDVNGDGLADVIVGAPEADSAYVYSGATGNLIWHFSFPAVNSFGYSVSEAGDVDGDTYADLIVGARSVTNSSGFTRAGAAFVYSGLSGGLIWRFDGQVASGYFGESVSSVGDVNRDGFSDVVVGAVGEDPGGRWSAGSVYVFSGATGNLLWRIDGEFAYDNLGVSVAAAGDVDRDGCGDLIVGAGRADPGGKAEAGSAFVYSGADGTQLWRFDGFEAGDLLGTWVTGAGDVDGDRHSDLLVSASGSDPNGKIDAGCAILFSGATGHPLGQFAGNSRNLFFGNAVSGVGDIDGNGLDEIIIGASLNSPPGGSVRAGSAYVWSLDPRLFTDHLEVSVSNGTPVTLGLDFPDSEAGKQYAILACISGTGPTTIGGIEVPLTNDAMLQRMLMGWSPSNMNGAFGVLNVNGDARTTIASDPILAPHIGKTYYLAAITYDGPTQTARLSSIARPIEIAP